MFFSLFFSLLFLIHSPSILSIKVGLIPHVSIKINSPISSSSTTNCHDCLCNCFHSSSCSGINCFSSNNTCQLIDQRTWILESDLSINFTTSNFLAMKENSSRLCSCYTPQKLLDYYGTINSTDYATTTNMRSIKYIPNDNTLIVLNETLIRKLSARNLNLILHNLSVSTSDAVSILHNDTYIYIAFAYNRSINMYDLNLTLLQISTSWSNQVAFFKGMFLFNNQILIIDSTNSIIWAIDSLSQSTLTKFFIFSSYNISGAVDLFISQNQYLYISTTSINLYIFYLINFTLQEILSPSTDVLMNYMRYDSNCHRLWFGTENYAFAPVLDLATNQMRVYTTNGLISTSGIYSVDFDGNYMAFYANTDGNLRQIYLANINC